MMYSVVTMAMLLCCSVVKMTGAWSVINGMMRAKGRVSELGGRSRLRVTPVTRAVARCTRTSEQQNDRPRSGSSPAEQRLGPEHPPAHC